MKKKRKLYQSIVEKFAIKIAKADANTACPCITYQPTVPAAVQKLRKF